MIFTMTEEVNSGFAAFTIDLTLYSDKIYIYTYVYPKFRPVFLCPNPCNGIHLVGSLVLLHISPPLLPTISFVNLFFNRETLPPFQAKLIALKQSFMLEWSAETNWSPHRPALLEILLALL